ncbi:helix-turn-helix transcriptional regulator [Paracoccus tegillarcae]|uniref:Excisionase n=1 Tax=Paracoccus tegillarcae TaxID=1529068 RepID=A0A2K9F106_9RHOB|nr:helix-turn-helix transcriptional regulator [Paracoccus tegillarcae]AUH32821.1 excisionase [Paracoccus tegillarcae]
MTESATATHEFLTVRELAELLRIKERKVYDLAASGQVPCSKATGKLLFPEREVRDWIARSGSRADTAQAARPPIVLGSHDPLLDWSIRQSQSGLATFFDGSTDGLQRFAKGEGIAAGIHIYDAKSASWNVAAATAAARDLNAVLISFARRRRGLVIAEGLDQPDGLADLAGLRFAPRQAESGTAILFRELATQASLDPATVTMTEMARTEDEAVEAVRRGSADATFGLESVAIGFGLRFVPVIEESFALLVDRKAWFEPAFQSFMAFCRQDSFANRAKTLGGYDISDSGQVIWNA